MMPQLKVKSRFDVINHLIYSIKIGQTQTTIHKQNKNIEIIRNFSGFFGKLCSFCE